MMAVQLADEARVRGRLELCLPRYLTEMTGSDVRDVSVTSLEMPPGGQSNETVLIDVSWEMDSRRVADSFVLRLQPSQNQIFLNADVLAEGELLQDLRRTTTLPVPTVFIIENDPEVLGRPFFLMSKVIGHVPGGRPSIHRDRWLISLEETERRRVIRAGIEALAAVHDTHWRNIRRFEGTRYDSRDETHQLQQWFKWAAQGRPYPTIELGLARIALDDVACDEEVLLWGDPRPGNIIFADDLSVAAIIDWEMASIGPAESDVGWWMMMDDFSRRGAESSVLPGLPTEEEMLLLYTRASGRSLSALEHFKLMAAIRLAITLIPIADSLAARNIISTDSEFARDNVPNQMIAHLVGIAEPQLCPDYLRLSRMRRLEKES
jgi:aminoglycoside phosphotransferase (APT) family kinase protein